MKRFYNNALLLLLSVALVGTSCSKKSDPEPVSVPVPDLSSKIIGVYNMTKLTNKDPASSQVFEGKGTVTIKAIDLSKVNVITSTTIKRLSPSKTSNYSSDFRYEVTQDGNTYILKNGGKTYFTIVSNVLTTELSLEDIVLGPPVSLKYTYFTGEFTK